MENTYSFNKAALAKIYNGQKKDYEGNPTNEADAIQEMFTVLQGEDLKRAHELYNLAIKHVNGNTYVQAEGTYEEYVSKRDEFFRELGFELNGRMLVEAEELEMER